MRAWAKVLLVFLALSELAVAGLYIMGVAGLPYVADGAINPHSLPNMAVHDPFMAVTLPVVLVVIVGAPVALVILGWRLVRRIGR
jgi:hypothetical protein